MAVAIQTRYAGYHFRSRLEARWAVFLNHLGTQWLYEPEGYDLPSGPYLPDFLVHPHTPFQFWLEIKPTLPEMDGRETALLRELADATGIRGFMYCRQPEPPVPLDRNWTAAYAERWHEDSRECNLSSEWPSEWYWDSGLEHTGVLTYPKSMGGGSLLCSRLWWTDCPVCKRVMLTNKGNITGCPRIDYDRVPLAQWGNYMQAGGVARITTPRLLAAYTAARSARFEHGETPR